MMETIKASEDISRVYSQGSRLNASTISLLVYKKRDGEPAEGRVAFAAGKKYGSAVWRNKAKRRLRAIAREMGAPWEGLDVVFSARPATTDAEYRKVLNQAQRLIMEYQNNK